MRLGAVRPSHVRTWCARLGAEGLADSYVYALHARLSQIYANAVHPLQSGTSQTPVPIPQSLALELSAHVSRWHAKTVLVNELGRQLAPWTLERAMRTARAKVPGLPAGSRFHDLRHYFASLLIASGSDLKVVQARLRHASAKTTLDTYGHLWPDTDDSTRAAIEAVMAARADNLRTAGDGA